MRLMELMESLQVVSQMGLQLLPRIKEAGADGADVAIHDGPNFFVGQPLNIVQSDNHSMVF
jgi:hypothetical protein